VGPASLRLTTLFISLLQETIQEFRNIIGIDMRAYVRCRLPNVYHETNQDPNNPLSKSYTSKAEEIFMMDKQNVKSDHNNNWNLKKQQRPQLKLKMPNTRAITSDYEINTNDVSSSHMKTLMSPGIMKSFQSIPKTSELSNTEDDEQPISPTSVVPANVIAHKARRTESVKFVDSHPSPLTNLSKPNFSQHMRAQYQGAISKSDSIIYLSECPDSDFESTDL